MIKVFTNYLIFFYMVKHLHFYMVSIYISYMIPFYMFVNLLTCWHFDSNQPKKKFSLVVIREAVVPCIEHTLVVEHVVLPYFVRSQVRQRLIGVSLTLYQPVDENSNVAPLRDAMTSHEKTSSLSVTT